MESDIGDAGESCINLEGLNRAIQILVIDGVLIVINASRRAGHLRRNEYNPIVSWGLAVRTARGRDDAGDLVSGESVSIAPLDGRLYRSTYLPPNAASNAAFLETLRLMVVHETLDRTGTPSGLELAYSTPRAWLEPGKQIDVAVSQRASGGSRTRSSRTSPAFVRRFACPSGRRSEAYVCAYGYPTDDGSRKCSSTAHPRPSCSATARRSCCRRRVASWKSRRSSADRRSERLGPDDGSSVEHDHSILVLDGRSQRRDRLVLARREHLDLGRDLVARPDRG